MGQVEQTKVMFDPSLLLETESLENVTTRLRRSRIFALESYDFYYPNALPSLLSDVEGNFRALNYFSARGELPPLSGVRSLLDSLTPFDRRTTEHPEVRELVSPVKVAGVSEILMDEWAFLQGQSILLSRVKKPFEAFIRAGGVALEVGKSGVDSLIRRTNKLERGEIINHVERLRALCKWIAVGGPTVAALFAPAVGILGGLAGGFFLLLDP